MKYINFLLPFVLLICFDGASQTTPSTLVKIEQGSIEGIIEDGIIVYKGIPFAAPPIGDLRWRPPQPAKSCEGVFKADHYAPACPQPIFPGISDLRYGTSEDCLYLNIWKPVETRLDKLPVLVWIHGGGFTIGTASQAVHDGEKLAARGLIVVSIAYRLGALGFLAHPGLSAESENHVSGNYGLLDQIAALQWIQKNIGAFGGDSGRVTIFGESAGGQSVSLLAVSPLAKGLFHRAICMSGGYFGLPSMRKEEETVQILKGAEEDGMEFEKHTGAQSLSELRTMDFSKLIRFQSNSNLGFSYWPVIDGYVIPDELQNLYLSGNFSDVPVLAGSTSDEGTLFLLSFKSSDYPSYLEKRFGIYAERILKCYPPGSTPDSIRRAAANLLRDSYFGWYTWSWASLQTKNGKSPVYVYYFDQTLPNSSATLLFKSNKPYHGSDIPYVFGHLNHDPKVIYPEEDWRLSDVMASYWVNFTATGNPNGKDLPGWPAYKDNRPQAMLLKAQPHVIDYPNIENIKLLDEYYKWKREKIRQTENGNQ